MFPNVTNTERTAGVTRYRKFFLRNENSSDLTLGTTRIWISERSSAADYFQITGGTDTDIESAADDYTNWSGTGLLASSVSSGEAQIEVTYDTSSGVYSGESVYLHIDDGSNQQEVKVDGTPSFIGNTATIDISGELNYNFTLTTTIVSTKVNLGDIEASSDSWAETSGSGTYNESSYPLVTYNVGTVKDSWTLTFSNATTFSVSGTSTGSVGSGTTSSNFQPANGASYYFKINKDGWGGTWADGDTVTFNTVHAGQGIWLKEVVPPGTASYSNSTVEIEWEGESA